MTLFDGNNDKRSFLKKLEIRLHAWTGPEFISLENKIKDLLYEIHKLDSSRGIYIIRCENLEAKIKAQDLLISKHKLEADYLSDRLIDHHRNTEVKN